jgi:hypothetical protein
MDTQTGASPGRRLTSWQTVMHPGIAAVRANESTNIKTIVSRCETNDPALGRKSNGHSSRAGGRMSGRFLPTSAPTHDSRGQGPAREVGVIDNLSIVTLTAKVEPSCLTLKHHRALIPEWP